jgi:hypothetical protein
MIIVREESIMSRLTMGHSTSAAYFRRWSVVEMKGRQDYAFHTKGV